MTHGDRPLLPHQVLLLSRSCGHKSVGPAFTEHPNRLLSAAYWKLSFIVPTLRVNSNAVVFDQ